MSTKTNDSESNKPGRIIDIYATEISAPKLVKKNSENNETAKNLEGSKKPQKVIDIYATKIEIKRIPISRFNSDNLDRHSKNPKTS